MLRLGSLFSGSGGFELGATLSGITPIFSAEVEPFPIRVTTKRFPNITHYGDVSKLNGAEVPPVDIITFGSPCQDMSVAGKRSGLDGERSGLFYQAVRIVKEMRCKTNGKYPRFVVWENVPGAFSSNKGEDFKAVLEALCKIKTENASVPRTEKGKWENAGLIMAEGFSLAWRVLDAQYFGVPQRRRRIYLVADFDGECAGKILFESEGLSGYSSPGGCSWKRVAGAVERGIGETGTVCLNDQGGNRMDVTEGVTCTLRAESHHPPLVFENHSQDARYTGPQDTAQTVLATFGTGGNNQPFVLETPKTLKIRSGREGGGKGALIQENKSATLGCNNDQTLFVPMAYGICSKDSNSMKSDNPHSGIYEADTSRTLDANGGNPACNQGGIVVVEGNGSRPSHKGDGYKESDVMYTLNTIEQHTVVYAIDRESYNCGQNYARKMGISEDGINSTLNAQGSSAVAAPVYSSSKASFFTSAEEELANTLVATDYKDPPIVNDVGEMPEYIVRRLTPKECARLQGFPDWWCSDLGTAEPTEEEVKWWSEVFETHRKILGTSSKPKTEKQIIKWLKDPHSDSAEYKMWGNGISLPVVVFVLAGIVWASGLEE
ncbi:DNA cytosine methyltransferase [Pectinatus frisingensis]|uniref:DNA cytosine methyltransferase n=1 Tax=Pectinatus frisingensis TaxID=865 RepID=UPI0018C51B7A|nr:DNA cytosine methyltransferase [Pectinatus frisingensis]